MALPQAFPVHPAARLILLFILPLLPTLQEEIFRQARPMLVEVEDAPALDLREISRRKAAEAAAAEQAAAGQQQAQPPPQQPGEEW